MDEDLLSSSTAYSSFLPSFLPSFTVWTARSADRRRRRCGVIKLDVQDKGRNIGDAAAAAAV